MTDMVAHWKSNHNEAVRRGHVKEDIIRRLISCLQIYGSHMSFCPRKLIPPHGTCACGFDGIFDGPLVGEGTHG